jgi:hypothetical protein
MRRLVITKESQIMKNRNHKTIIPARKATEGKIMKLQVDYRTTIVVRTQKALEMWMEKYPNAKVVA